ncbi:MAG: CotH kinase family protein [Anaerolineae bacterium]|nr:CotH kinase family protein [Anaerolineae bacterium]
MSQPCNRRALYRIVELASIGGFVLASIILAIWNPRASPGLPAEAATSLEALASAMPNQGWAPLQVTFSAFGSLAGSGAPTRYEWDLDGNGIFDTDATAQGGYAAYTYAKPGIYRVALRVTDAQGYTAADSLTVTVRHPASSPVDYWTIFDDTTVRRVDVTLTQADWVRLWENPETKLQVRADAVIFGERLEDVGFKMRGQFSLRESGAKKPWEIDTDAFVPGQEFHNLKQLLFINNIGDPTLLREKLAYDMLRFAGVPASHVCFVELWIDLEDDDAPAEFWGVYTLVERIDRKYLASRFGQDSKGGNLYKASHAQRGPMDLIYYGPDISDYPTQGGSVAYGKVTNEEANDYSDIVELCYVIDGVSYASPEAFTQALEAHFNVDGFLRYMAVQVALANWDYYPNTGNNYYLFHDPVTDRFEWLPWDQTWGEDARQPLFSLDGFRLVERAPLYDRVFEVDRYRRQYAAYLDLLSRHWFTYENLYTQAAGYHTLIAPYVTQGTGDKMFSGAGSGLFGGIGSPEGMLVSPGDFETGWMRLAEFAGERGAYIQEALLTESWTP